jgi:hypothetical protein
MYTLFFLGLAILSALIHLARVKKRTTPVTVEIILLWLIVWCIGVQGMFAATFQIAMPEQIAKGIGWQQSPFEFEVAAANLGVGIAGFLALIWRGKYWLGPIITYLVFIYGAAYGHFVQEAKGDHAAYNTGIFLYAGDIIIPTIILIFAILYFFIVLPKYKQ